MRGHLVEILRAAGAQDHRPRREQVLLGAGARDLDQEARGTPRPSARRPRCRRPSRPRSPRPRPAPARAPRRRRGPRRARPRRSGSRCGRRRRRPRAAPRTAARAGGRAAPARSAATPASESTTHRNSKLGSASSSGDHLADRLAADQLVRHQHPRHAEAAADHQLLDGRDRDAPGAVGELAGEQLRRHRGLAVRAQADVEALEEAPHPAAVVAERRALEDGDRQRQVLAQQVPALLADRARAAARRPAPASPWWSARSGCAADRRAASPGSS